MIKSTRIYVKIMCCVNISLDVRHVLQKSSEKHTHVRKKQSITSFHENCIGFIVFFEIRQKCIGKKYEYYVGFMCKIENQ